MEFLSEDNIAGQTLLRLVARGSAIIAELLRLSDHVPPVFLVIHSMRTMAGFMSHGDDVHVLGLRPN